MYQIGLPSTQLVVSIDFSNADVIKADALLMTSSYTWHCCWYVMKNESMISDVAPGYCTKNKLHVFIKEGINDYFQKEQISWPFTCGNQLINNYRIIKCRLGPVSSWGKRENLLCFTDPRSRVTRLFPFFNTRRVGLINVNAHFE